MIDILVLAASIVGTPHNPREKQMHHEPSSSPVPSLESFKGKMAGDAVLADLRRTAGSRDIRVVRQGGMMTMDHIDGRLTIVVDDDGRIVRIYRG